jgi:predicted amidophosphoribosyltransferase
MTGALVVCPVSDLVGPEGRHTFPTGAGVVIPWHVMGDERQTVEVCPACAHGAEPETCENCGGAEDVAGGLCAPCFSALPDGEWCSVGSWGAS